MKSLYPSISNKYFFPLKNGQKQLIAEKILDSFNFFASQSLYRESQDQATLTPITPQHII